MNIGVHVSFQISVSILFYLNIFLTVVMTSWSSLSLTSLPSQMQFLLPTFPVYESHFPISSCLIIFFFCCWKMDILDTVLQQLIPTPWDLSLFLLNCLVIWLAYFSAVYYPCSLQPLMSFFRGHSLGYVHRHPELTAILAWLSLTASFPNLSQLCSSASKILDR